jgi:hypothetical protein
VRPTQRATRHEGGEAFFFVEFLEFLKFKRLGVIKGLLDFSFLPADANHDGSPERSAKRDRFFDELVGVMVSWLLEPVDILLFLRGVKFIIYIMYDFFFL